MKILLVAATEMEISRLLPQLTGRNDIDVLITGVGMTATAYALAKALAKTPYGFVLQAGVGGSYNRDIALGEVVFVTSDIFADLGAEDHDRYFDIFEMGLVDGGAAPFTNGRLVNPKQGLCSQIALRQASGLTVNTVSGSAPTIKMRTEKYGCDIESMEGAALHYVCLQENVPFAQVRAISNYVTPRDKSQWKMKDAVTNLCEWVGQLMHQTLTA